VRQLVRMEVSARRLLRPGGEILWCRASRAHVRKFGKHALVGIEGMR